MNVTSPAYTGIQSASESLNLLAQRIAGRSTERVTQSVSDAVPKAGPTVTTGEAPQEVSEGGSARGYESTSEEVSTRSTTSSGGQTSQVETYNATGRVNERSQSSITELMAERLNAENNLRANVEVAKATNNIVGKLIDETV
jgi:hypothetical protein